MKRLFASVLLVLMLAGCGVNNIPTYEEAAKAKWADVETQYQRRADLVPNLVNTVKGFAAQETSVLTQVTEARAQATKITVDPTNPESFKQFEEVQGKLGSSLGRLLAISENYPDLKSNQNFLTLQSQLEGTENRIAVARRDFNEAVRVYNTELRTIPGKWWAALMYKDAKPMEMFQASAAGAENAPAVTF